MNHNARLYDTGLSTTYPPQNEEIVREHRGLLNLFPLTQTHVLTQHKGK